MLAWIKQRLDDWRWSRYEQLSRWADSQKQPVPGLHNYWDLPILCASHFSRVRIIVDSEAAKDQILRALHYLDSLRSLDTDYVAVNYLVHLYQTPDAIEVDVPPQLHPAYAHVGLATHEVTPEVADWVRDLEPLSWHWYFDDPKGMCRFYFRKHEDAAAFLLEFPTAHAG